MEERQFRFILTLLAVTAVLVVGVEVVALNVNNGPLSVNLAGQAVRLVGLVLLAIAAIGLWHWRSWGFWVLGLSTVLSVMAALPEGVLPAIWRSFLHLTTILLVAEHYYERQAEKEAAEEHGSDHPH